MTIYYDPKNKNTYIVPNHYNRTLEYIKETLEWAKSKGLTVPKDDDIRFEVLAGDRHARMLSIEFCSNTPPDCDFIDLNKYPHMFNSLKY